MVDDESLRAKAAALAGFGETGADHLNCAQAVVRFAAILPDASQDSVVLARNFGRGMKGWARSTEPCRERPSPWDCAT